MIKNKLSLLFLSFKKIKKFDDDDDEKEESSSSSSTEKHSNNLFSRLTFKWVKKLILKGYNKDSLDLKDIPPLPNNLKSNFTTKTYLKNLKSNIYSSKSSNYSIIYYLYKNFLFSHYKKVLFLNLSLIILSALSPFSLQLFIEYIQKPKVEKSFIIGFLYCLLLFISSISMSLINEYYYWFGNNCSVEIRGSLTTLLFEKLLKLSNSSKTKYNAAKITNLISTDVDVIANFFWARQTEIFFNPIQVIFLFCYLISVVGIWSGLVGIVVMIISIPINSYICNKSSSAYEKSLKYSDKRCNTTNELINGIRFLKMYAWEKLFLNKIEKQRQNELKLLYEKVLCWIGESVMIYTSSTLVLVATFATYSLLGNKTITLEVAFTTMSILENLKAPLINIPYDYYSIMTLIPSCKRIKNFLICSELQDNNNSGGRLSEDIKIKNGTFKWNQDSDINDSNSDSDQENEKEDNGSRESINYKLSNINFKAPHGKLTMICSPVGSGKSSLLAALLGEMYRVGGQVDMIPDNISYTNQQPFLLNTSLRENILFGKPMNLERYKKVIKACSLVSDLSQFPLLDLTEIGERGINLSGGQKQRISLARALYSNSDCYIMDEPLAAVDSRVATHLFENCIQGMMENKTRILVTHQLQFIKLADHIVLIDKQGSIIQGTYNELVDKGLDFQSIIETTHINTNDNDEKNDRDSQRTTTTIENLSVEKVIMNDKDFNESNYKKESKILVDEDKNKGNINLDVYKSYLNYGTSKLFFIITFLMFFVSQLVSSLCDFWITYWTEQSIATNNINNRSGQIYYIGFYIAIIALYILTIVLGYLMLAKITLKCSNNLHSKLLSSISLAPVQFFDSNPSGRILNRFSKDLSEMDIPMIDILSDTLRCYSAFFIGIASIIYINPMTIVPFTILSIFYYFVQSIYRPSVRELNRLESISQSPVFSLVQECHNGLTTIRSFKQQSTFIEKMNILVDDNLRCAYSSYALNTWISLRLETLSSVIVFVVSLFSLYNCSTNVGLSVLAVTTSLNMTGYLNSAINQTVSLEVLMNSFQRIHSFIKTPPEAPQHLDTDDHHSKKDWPSNGDREFDKVQIKYPTAIEPSLLKFSLNTHGNEKIGIVGRTGAGKTTIASGLFRLVECSKGSIIIDGVDISTIGLKKLRSSLGIVPQEPWLFSGSIRLNIDPFEQYSDDEIWSILELVCLDKTISEMPLGLKTKIPNNDGQVFSFGQKQLLSLSRCLLKNPKIILLDEPSSSLDFQTSDLIKNVLAKYFYNNTVITIAHKLDTIIKSSKIALLDKGKLIEFDTPNNLIENNNSEFKKLLNFYKINHQ